MGKSSFSYLVEKNIKTIKKNKMVQEETKQVEMLDANQLEKLQAFEKFMKAAREAMGSLQINYEVQKGDILNQVLMQQKEIAELEKVIKEQYGDIRVNIETGEIVKQPVVNYKMKESLATA
jgi:hypothetical protein